LILSGVARLLVEFIRLNPKLLGPLSEAQVISVGLILIGIAFYYKAPFGVIAPEPVKVKREPKKKKK
jgi:phosphatidylglycerol---prolipoprotein diacylglyceryl transferase